MRIQAHVRIAHFGLGEFRVCMTRVHHQKIGSYHRVELLRGDRPMLDPQGFRWSWTPEGSQVKLRYARAHQGWEVAAQMGTGYVSISPDSHSMTIRHPTYDVSVSTIDGMEVTYLHERLIVHVAKRWLGRPDQVEIDFGYGPPRNTPMELHYPDLRGHRVLHGISDLYRAPNGAWGIG